MFPHKVIESIAAKDGHLIKSFLQVFLEHNPGASTVITSWPYINQYAPASANSIKMLADTLKIDTMDLLSLQYYDAHFHYINKTNKRKHGHCLACVDKKDAEITFGQTWDTYDWYPSLVQYKYPSATCLTYPGILGGPFVSTHKYGTTWTGLYPQNLSDGIPTPLLFYEAMLSPTITSAKDFTIFEQQYVHCGGHGILAIDNNDTYYIERNCNRVLIDKITAYPFSHSNEYMGYDSNAETISNKRVELINKELQMKPIGTALTLNTRRTVSVWYNLDADGFYTQGAFRFDINKETITPVYPNWRVNRSYRKRYKKTENTTS